MVAELEERHGELSSRDGTRLRWRAWDVESEAPVVAVVHGHGEHGGRYSRLARALAPHGHSTYAFDLRGMGESAGQRGHVGRWQEWVEDVAAFAAFAQDRAAGREVVPLGHSMGGVLLVSSLLAGAVGPRRFVVSNPAFETTVAVPSWKIGLGRLTSRLAPRLAMGTGLDPAQISRDPEQVAAYREDPLVHDRMTSRFFTEWRAASEEALRRAAEVTQPFLLILGEADPITDIRAARRFAERTRAEHQVKVYEGRYHEPFNDVGSEEVFTDLAGWLAAGPS